MNIADMMKQARVMQEKMETLQGQLAVTEVEGVSGAGLVRVVMTCKGDVRMLKISPEIINPSDAETLEDLVMAAVNMARQNADQTMASETARMMEEMGLPSNFELPKF
ncbi:MAG: YbaB/EbfC family nucleoid-associated protein [Micavibrio aeruginosavorus]|uniref:Nucleoid-associated protein HYS17_02405 n=1 Tax=Micavibrio aeruginosavorus TaxID=349221 RepID=A0A7T5R365_9BACT|nr:MAG: YbaB/EbfC family nucleoid-associated protein [Micavibrio aeruginosavorus]